MRCAKCGEEVKPTDPCCPYCSQRCADIRDLNGGESGDEGSGEGTGAGRRVYFKELSFSRLGIWPMVLGAVILTMIIIFALPLALLGILIFAVYRCLTRRRF